MRTLAKWLRRLADWIDPVDALLTVAMKVVVETQSLERSGPYKHARALSLLRRQCPGERESRLRWAIETAVQRL